MATTWGVCFSGLSSLLYLVARLSGSLPAEVFGARMVLAIAARGFVVGAFAGAVFSLVLAAAERRRTLAGLSSARVALWGFLGTAAVPLLYTALSAPDMFRYVPISVIAAGTLAYGAIGSAIATTILRIARRAPAHAIESAELSHLESGKSK